MNGDPHFGSTGKGGYSRNKRGQAFFRAEVHILAGPRVVAAD